MDNNSGIADIIIDKHNIDDETFNKENIILNFEEYISLSSTGVSSFLNYKDENNTGREFYITGSIFSKKLDGILKAFDEKVINSPDFIKIKEKDKYFIENLRNERAFKKFKKSKKNRNIKPRFETIINMVKTLKGIGENEGEMEEYGDLISELLANLEKTIENLELIEKAIKNIEAN
ncbi:hypothetical protein [Methanobrevibacter curvatus]|uniref:Uncharacterized protein n=1 Tax=Methanobrevibacter curvatus TaxID=49547 RepID=A0A166DRE1_9EURY|nr:hypothetical protein [Methanobrevibacter curvatus]KZX15875.1 hypothetical protein MBCUR_01870 [Methanobrevibacter curvatus]